MEASVWHIGIVLVMSFGGLICADSDRVSPLDVCPREIVTDGVFGLRDSYCVIGGPEFLDLFVHVTEGDDVLLQRALNNINNSGYEFIGVLFYASWCPFSKNCRPTFSILSSLYPSIPHFAIQESAVRPSVLSKYGVHGFPTIFLLNSTMRMRYHGSRTLASLIGFYGNVTGIQIPSPDEIMLEKMNKDTNPDKNDENNMQRGEKERCPFSWAKSPENWVPHETYLALATAFVVLRVLCFVLPNVTACVEGIWRRHVRNMSVAYLNHSIQILRSLREPCKRSNLQGGAKNAKAWASKSLASVSIGGDASTGRASSSPPSCCR